MKTKYQINTINQADTKPTTLVRNIGIIAHVDAGKTTVSERLLFYSGKIHGMGETHQGESTLDFGKSEINHGITISSAATSISWREHRVNLIDTPGHIDFNIEVKRALRVLDGAVVVFDGVSGVEPQTETNWQLADQFGVPRIAFINKMDRSGADFDKTCDMIRTRLRAKPIPVQMPFLTDGIFEGVVDLISMKLIRWVDDRGLEMSTSDIPADILASAQDFRRQSLESLAEFDDQLLELILEEAEIPESLIRHSLRRATVRRLGVPVLCGTALKNCGIQPLLDAIVEYLPAPEDRDPAPGTVSDQFCGFIFKTTVPGSYGELAMTRIYSGNLSAGNVVINSSTGKKERISRIVEVHAQQYVERDSASAGEIVALIGLKHSNTGDTICSAEHLVVLEKLDIPEPVTSVVVEASSREQNEKLSAALHRIAREDPTLRLGVDAETGQTMMLGMGELHLSIAREKIEEIINAKVHFGKPTVSYRETITASGDISYLHKKQTGGPGQYAGVSIRFDPLPRGSGIEFVDEVTGAAIPIEYIPSVKKGILEKAQSGPLKGHPMVDFRATLYDGETHANDSNQRAFEVAGSLALAEAMKQCEPVLLEPVMSLTITCPESTLGDVIGDLSRRRGIVMEQKSSDDLRIVEAEVPLSRLFGYIGDLRSLTSGRANYSMVFDHYDYAL